MAPPFRAAHLGHDEAASLLEVGLADDAKASDPTAELTYPVADDQTNRYAAASGDTFEIHLDDEAARAVGLPGRILHGLCTMLLSGRISEAHPAFPRKDEQSFVDEFIASMIACLKP